MHSMFSDVLPRQVFADRPPAPGGDVDRWAAGFRALAAAHAAELAGIVVEPLLQGAGGMHVYDPQCLRVMREVADEHGLVLVFDEIATGFGRTGTFFAAQAADVSPDVMCVGKALTAGYLTLAAVLTTTEVAHGVSASESGVLMHGPTYMGNPLACAVALASLDLLESSDWRANVARVGAGLTAGLTPLRHRPGVADVRTVGAVGVVQLDHPVDVVKATDAAAEEGVWLRPFRDLVYTMPPYVTPDEDVARICRAVERAVDVT
jgi:adenosylmethionine-8-amino-7-oxononanoate aminotransferase